MYKNGKLTLGYGAGWYGLSVSIVFIELFELIFGGEIKWDGKDMKQKYQLVCF